MRPTPAHGPRPGVWRWSALDADPEGAAEARRPAGRWAAAARPSSGSKGATPNSAGREGRTVGQGRRRDEGLRRTCGQQRGCGRRRGRVLRRRLGHQLGRRRRRQQLSPERRHRRWIPFRQRSRQDHDGTCDPVPCFAPAPTRPRRVTSEPFTRFRDERRTRALRRSLGVTDIGRGRRRGLQEGPNGESAVAIIPCLYNAVPIQWRYASG
jgi:hypothetical protein